MCRCTAAFLCFHGIVAAPVDIKSLPVIQRCPQPRSNHLSSMDPKDTVRLSLGNPGPDSAVLTFKLDVRQRGRHLIVLPAEDLASGSERDPLAGKG
jgi:hypothetical protein